MVDAMNIPHTRRWTVPRLPKWWVLMAALAVLVAGTVGGFTVAATAGTTASCPVAGKGRVANPDHSIDPGLTVPVYDESLANLRAVVVDDGATPGTASQYEQELDCVNGKVQEADTILTHVSVANANGYRVFTVTWPAKAQVIEANLSVSTGGITFSTVVLKSFKVTGNNRSVTFKVRNKGQILNDGSFNGFSLYVRDPGRTAFYNPKASSAALAANTATSWSKLH